MHAKLYILMRLLFRGTHSIQIVYCGKNNTFYVLLITKIFCFKKVIIAFSFEFIVINTMM